MSGQLPMWGRSDQLALNAIFIRWTKLEVESDDEGDDDDIDNTSSSTWGGSDQLPGGTDQLAP